MIISIIQLDIGNLFENNIFLASGNGFSNVSGCTFYRNIFLTTVASPGTSNSFFTENLFVGDWSGNFGTNSNVNNIFNQAQGSIFINQSGNQFDFGHNYHIQTASPGYANGGVNQIGIYGGNNPFKDNGHPAIPRYILINISNSTDASGNLPIQIKVEVQTY